MAVRSEHGFLFGLPWRGQLLVGDMPIDDMVLTDDAQWPDEGAALLRHAARAAHPAALRFVCPVPERPRADAARAVGLTVAESWWHRDLGRQPSAPAAELGEDCRLVPASPVYDPGGPVLLVRTVSDADTLTRAEQAAAVRGATVSVVSQDPADAALATLLTRAGYRRTTDYFSTPVRARRFRGNAGNDLPKWKSPGHVRCVVHIPGGVYGRGDGHDRGEFSALFAE